MSDVQDERWAALRDEYDMWAAVRDRYEPHLRNEQELRFAARIRVMQREEPCECPAPARPAGLDNPNVPAQYRTVFAHHCTRCLGRLPVQTSPANPSLPRLAVRLRAFLLRLLRGQA
jgi:hypothetical protein